jgi:rhodanese-related sulfurtransferase
MIEDLTPREAAERLAADDPPLLVDVREDWEHELAAIDGAVHIPLDELPARLTEIPADRPAVLHCHHGARSLQAATWMQAQGYDHLANLDGGIDAWSLTVDPSVPRYR